MRIDLDRSPRLVSKVEIDLPLMAADPHMDRAHGSFEQRPCFKHLDRGAQGLTARYLTTRRDVVLVQEPLTEATGTHRPGLAVLVNNNVGIALAIGGME